MFKILDVCRCHNDDMTHTKTALLDLPRPISNASDSGSSATKESEIAKYESAMPCAHKNQQ